ncbi:hypothetical protein [uncultured Hyphomicrobium sp.]|uniref:hypothetical protein n=1 Tax=uncultured Hyphomicrobium sp. TaxID=194373 RepID=UPI0025E302A7|nr:hypothetical protein [uncultured Hyphomicrobium sp.]
MPAFGPLGARASTVRPSADNDAYGVQTWFKNCSAPGASDGTVPTASWFNHLIGNLNFLCAQADVEVTNDQANDTFIWQAIENAINQKIGGASAAPWGL